MKIIKNTFMGTLFLAAAASFASETPYDSDWSLNDLTLKTNYSKYVCSLLDKHTITPDGGLEDYEVEFEKFVGSRGLWTFLLTANFKQDEASCRYNLFLS